MQLIKKKCYDKEYYEVRDNGTLLFEIFEDVFSGWRPYSIWGYCFTVGRPAHKSLKDVLKWWVTPE